ncbi:MAG: hypothetical protein JOZ08_24255 [Verrucomicrobia bacterium]|nr:hypothetical protein [Verrucomicrobiota bacterium]
MGNEALPWGGAGRATLDEATRKHGSKSGAVEGQEVASLVRAEIFALPTSHLLFAISYLLFRA